MLKYLVVVMGVLAAPVFAQVSSYEGTSFPEEENAWSRYELVYQAERWLESGWLVQYAEIANPGPPVEGERDSYRRELTDQSGLSSWYLEWVMVTDGPEAFGAVAPACIVVGGRSGVRYHFTIANDRVRLLRDSQLPFVFADIDPAIPHLYRLELRGTESYRFSIDAVEIDSGIPEGAYPTADSRITFGATAAIQASTTRWDYIRFGAIPVDGSGDYDSDADVDGRDFYFFHECLSNRRPGINGGPDENAGPGCRFADFDFDTDVDLRDIAVFQQIFTGSE